MHPCDLVTRDSQVGSNVEHNGVRSHDVRAIWNAYVRSGRVRAMSNTRVRSHEVGEISNTGSTTPRSTTAERADREGLKELSWPSIVSNSASFWAPPLESGGFHSWQRARHVAVTDVRRVFQPERSAHPTASR